MPDDAWDTKWSMRNDTCSACDEPIHEGQDSYQCEWCENKYHNECSEHEETDDGFMCLECTEDQRMEKKAHV